MYIVFSGFDSVPSWWYHLFSLVGSTTFELVPFGFDDVLLSRIRPSLGFISLSVGHISPPISCVSFDLIRFRVDRVFSYQKRPCGICIGRKRFSFLGTTTVWNRNMWRTSMDLIRFFIRRILSADAFGEIKKKLMGFTGFSISRWPGFFLSEATVRNLYRTKTILISRYDHRLKPKYVAHINGLDQIFHPPNPFRWCFRGN